ncbi:NADH kinase [Drechslerella dactyloides]|uniref:NADH kinase n=1 Tax=Drechslerella dactyloides TaxID=74499 RepID=A0AAD6J3U7_DREDA|nr:NADH kinase [Drechslerella dactyloides]
MASADNSDPGGSRSSNLEKLVGGPVAAALYKRRAEFLHRDKCTVTVTAWNVAAVDDAHTDIAAILHHPSASPGIDSDEKEEPPKWALHRPPKNNGTKRLPKTKVEVYPVFKVLADLKTDKEDVKPRSRAIRELYKKLGTKHDLANKSRLLKGMNPVSKRTQEKEVVDVSAPENFLRTVDEGVQKRWRGAIQAALPDYRCLIVEQLVGLLMFVFISPDIASQITTPSGTTVGTGLMGYMGNKGGALGRIVIGGLPAAGVCPPSLVDASIEEKEEAERQKGTTVVFVNCHLAAFPNAVDRRNWDYAEIQRRAYFHPTPLPISGGGTAPESVAAAHPNGYPFSECDLVLWAGDLNYRLDITGDEIRKSLHTFLPPEADGSDPPLKLKANADASNASDEPGSERRSSRENNRTFEETIAYLLENDQLRKQQMEGKAFQFFHEGKILFLPTYKYDFGTISTFDSSEKARVPSYCDRIVWKDWKVEKEEIERLEARKLADARDKKRETHLDGSESNDVLFDIGQEETEDPGEDSDAKLDDSNAVAPSQLSHEITTINEIDISDISTPLKLQRYLSHQTITSSDHKPITAEFSLEYLAVDQDKRSQVQVEIVREIDRHENESRPAVTLIVDGDPNNEIVDFGEVAWDQVVRRTVTIANTGRSEAACEFVTRPVMPALSDDDDEEDSGFMKITSTDISDSMAFGDEDSAAGGLEEEVCKVWLSVRFANAQTEEPYLLKPGEAEPITLQLALPPRRNGRQSRAANAALLRHLNTGKEDLSDILVMRVSQGQDKFIPVKAKFKTTFLGYSLTELLRVPDSAGGIRDNPKCNGEAHWSAPRELFRMTEYLLLTLKSIVLSEGGEGVRWTMLPGWPFVRDTWGLADTDTDDGEEGEDELTSSSIYARSALKRWIRNGLDCDRDWAWEEVDRKGYSEEDKCEVMAECLLDWLGYLKNGVIPTSLYGEVVKGVGGKAGADKILDMLPTAAPPVHTNVFIYLTGFVSEVISLLSPKYDAATTSSNISSAPLSAAALVKRLSASSRITTTELKEGMPSVTEAMLEFAKYLTSTYPDTKIILEPHSAADLHSSLPFPIYSTSVAKIPPDSSQNPYHLKTSLTVTFGGDGTILHAASIFSTTTVVPPLLSFALGTLGFLGPWQFSDFKQAVDAVWSNNARIMRRSRIKMQVFEGEKQLSGDLWPAEHQAHEIGPGGDKGVYAMNEVHIHRGRNPHMAVVDVFVDGRLLTEAVADGIILSTPTGSTAYSLSSFGSIVHPRVPAILLTPICPRSLSFRPLVLPAESEVSLRLSPKTRCKEVEVSIDGKRWGGVHTGVEVRVSGEMKNTGEIGQGGVPCIWREGSEHEDEWVSGLNGLLKFNYPFGEEVQF